MINILIVEDEDSIANLLKLTVNEAGYLSHIANDGEMALEYIKNYNFDLVLLDIMIPKIDGFDLMEYMKVQEIPTIFITAMNDINSKVKGLKLGADDYITKPFDIDELLARIEVVLRRYHKTDSKIIFKNIEVDINSHIIKKDGNLIELTKKEFDILLLFLRNKNRTLYREVIYERIWNEDFIGDTRTVDLHIQRLRKKLDLEDTIETVYKIGYRFVDK